MNSDRDAAITWVAGNARTGIEPLRELARDASVVGLGASTRGAAELFELQHRALRLLVEDLGYRALVLEEDWTTGLILDAYARTGEGDPRALLAEAWLPWQTEEVLDALVWVRSFNRRHPDDPVRIVGMDSAATRASAYDLVTGYVRRAAPERLGELREHYAPLRPTGQIDEHVGRYRGLDDRRPLIDRAERAYDLVAGLPGGAGHAEALQHARVIVTFHHFHDGPVMDKLPYIERRMAETLLWWLDQTGDKAVYWGGLGHVAAAETAVTGEVARTNTGGLLRRRLGGRYVPVALTFDHGAVHGGVPVPAPPAGFADSVLGAAGPAEYLLDLRAGPVPAWFGAPGRTRVIGPGYRPEDDARHHLAGGSLAGWFDAVVHTQEVTPSHLIGG